MKNIGIFIKNHILTLSLAVVTVGAGAANVAVIVSTNNLPENTVHYSNTYVHPEEEATEEVIAEPGETVEVEIPASTQEIVSTPVIETGPTKEEICQGIEAKYEPKFSNVSSYDDLQSVRMQYQDELIANGCVEVN